jgi:hypothetical protein
LGGISSEFSSIPVTRRRYSDNEQKNRDAQFALKNGQKPKPRVTQPIAGRQKRSPAAGVVFSPPPPTLRVQNVYFGYPQAHEDDAERAVRELLARIAIMKLARAASKRMA